MQIDDFLVRAQRAAMLDSPDEAERMAKIVLGALADLLPDSQSRRQFATQLPGPLKAHVAGQPARTLAMDRNAFLQHVAAGLGTRVPGAERAVMAVWQVVREAVAAGELADFHARVPPDIAAWLGRA